MPQEVEKPKTDVRLVLQQEYNAKRHGEPDNWEWVDSPYRLHGSTDDDQIADAKRFVAHSPGSKFTRAHRIVKRVMTVSDFVVEEIGNG